MNPLIVDSTFSRKMLHCFSLFSFPFLVNTRSPLHYSPFNPVVIFDRTFHLFSSLPHYRFASFSFSSLLWRYSFCRRHRRSRSFTFSTPSKLPGYNRRINEKSALWGPSPLFDLSKASCSFLSIETAGRSFVLLPVAHTLRPIHLYPT